MSDYAENAIDATIAHQPSPGERFYPAFEVTPELDAAASEYVTHYPEGKQKSAVLPILHEIQKKFGFISGDAIAWVGEKLNISAAHVLGVVTFYPGLRQMCPGKKPHPRMPHSFLRHGGGGQPVRRHLHASGH
ncbi:NAD(P)H-dependent oxidoreductase subunit E [Akkermansia muciniphila]|uniref:NADH-quinone oxidoreductase subunit NuoE family protein n=1 Tax=Akkermansia muciniphila TaxID=239935 RepID=UPI00211E29AE|nr:NAD(P)H-dependent oxidoreductase subunit E [Akkermansia muciniphila]